jgi:hypothetical protein
MRAIDKASRQALMTLSLAVTSLTITLLSCAREYAMHLSISAIDLSRNHQNLLPISLCTSLSDIYSSACNQPEAFESLITTATIQ